MTEDGERRIENRGPTMQITHFTELRVYHRAFELAARIFVISKRWPPEERYSLTDQIRRAARSVGANSS